MNAQDDLTPEEIAEQEDQAWDEHERWRKRLAPSAVREDGTIGGGKSSFEQHVAIACRLITPTRGASAGAS